MHNGGHTSGYLGMEEGEDREEEEFGDNEPFHSSVFIFHLQYLISFSFC